MQQYITDANLVTETYTFAAALDTNMPLRGTIIGGLDTLVNSAVTNFQSYACESEIYFHTYSHASFLQG